MAAGFFALLDDVSILMDDVAAMAKVAAKKTAGILGDDLAVNAEKSAKFDDDRELPVLYKIAKGAFINKLILLPLIFTLSYFLPQAIVPILIIGGFYLGYEGVEKVLHYLKKDKHNEQHNDFVDLNKNTEDKKIKSAILIDFILSIEIVIIALSTVLDKPFLTQVVVVTAISILAVVFVYGIVGVLIRMDNVGFWMQSKYKHPFLHKFGGFLISSLPVIIKILGIVGTIAMLLVAGGIFIHNVDVVHHISASINLWLLNDLIVGFLFGLVAFAVIESVLFVKNKIKRN